MKGVLFVRAYPFPISLLNLALAGLTAGAIMSATPSLARAEAPAAPVVKPTVKQTADQYFDQFLFPSNPSLATELGVHQYDADLEDYAPKAIAERIASLKTWQQAVEAI